MQCGVADSLGLSGLSNNREVWRSGVECKITRLSLFKCGATIVERWVQTLCRPPHPQEKASKNVSLYFPLAECGRYREGITYGALHTTRAPLLALNSNHPAEGVPLPTASCPNFSKRHLGSCTIWPLLLISSNKSVFTMAISQDNRPDGKSRLEAGV